MPLFLLGIALGLLSGGATYGFTDDQNLSLVIGGVVAILTWFGSIVLIVIDD